MEVILLNLLLSGKSQYYIPSEHGEEDLLVSEPLKLYFLAEDILWDLLTATLPLFALGVPVKNWILNRFDFWGIKEPCI